MAQNLAQGFKIDGLDEFLEELRNAPKEIQAKAEQIVRTATYSTAHNIRTVYQKHRTDTDTYGRSKRKRKHLADHVVVRFRGSETGAAAGRVWIDAPHANFFEKGTKIRHWTNHPSQKNTGAAPAHHVVSTIAVAKRRRMHEELFALLRDQGLKVMTRA